MHTCSVLQREIGLCCLALQEAYGKLQEWTVSSQAASHQLAKRAGALQEAMQVIWGRAGRVGYGPYRQAKGLQRCGCPDKHHCKDLPPGGATLSLL